jgi:hypothetical protein
MGCMPSELTVQCAFGSAATRVHSVVQYGWEAQLCAAVYTCCKRQAQTCGEEKWRPTQRDAQGRIRVSLSLARDPKVGLGVRG